MGQMSRADIIDRLVKAGTPSSTASLYADQFLTYAEAQANVEKNGCIVSHPRTANPVTNPYLPIRDAAAKNLAGIRARGTDFLWATGTAPTRRKKS